jgi:hypothetical protein
VTPSSFRVGWTTPNTIRWEWDPDPDALVDEFQHYELCLSTADPQGMEPGSTKVWTAEDNAELGGFGLPQTGGALDPVRATVTDDLEDKTPYWGQLRAVDVAGCAWASQVVAARTELDPKPENLIPLFQDQLLGTTDPVSMHVEEDASLAHGGSAYLAYDPDCNDPSPACACCENLKVVDMQVPIDRIGFDVGKTAFWEIAISASEPSYWSTVYVEVGLEQFWRFEPYTISPGRDGGYRVIQIPLRALKTDNGAALAEADLVSPLSQFVVSGTWSLGGRVRIDEVRIRW